jgi:hypothetical protein
MGNNHYPKTPMEAYNLLVNYKNYANNTNKRGVPGGLDQVAFLVKRGREGDSPEETAERPKKDRSKLMCFNCLQYGHYKSECKNPDPRKQGGTQSMTATTLMTRAKVMMMHNEEEINPMWILCDNESSIDVIKNANMITNIRPPRKTIELTGIGGKPMQIQHEGELLGYGTVYYHPKVAANILSFHNLTKKFKSVTYNNKVRDAFVVTRDNGLSMEFVPSSEGLYYYNFENSIKRKEEQSKQAMAMVIQTVENVQRNFTK